MSAWLVALAFVLATSAVSTPSFVGTWKGAIHLGTSDLECGLAVTRAADTLAATIDIPAQGATALPLRSVRQWGDSVHFELAVPGASGVFDGAVRADSVRGVFRQSGLAFPFSLARSVPGAVAVEPPVPYRRDEVKVTSGAVTLAGTLTRPEGKGPFPAVVLLSGSGAQNRDEEMFGFKPFRILADHLTRHGIAVLRTDDRGVGGSTGSLATATLDHFAADAAAAVAFLRARSDVDRSRVGLLGHSEGGLVAARVAAGSRDVAFVVMLAGPTVRGDTLMIAQAELIGRVAGQPEALRAQNEQVQRMVFRLARTGEGREETERQVRAVTRRALGAPETGGTPEQESIVEANVVAQMAMADSPWLRTFVEYDPGPTLARVGCPVLGLFGENDLQVPPALNAPPLEAVARTRGRDVTVRVVPRTNHLFQQADSGSPALYPMLPKAFAPGVLDTIRTWIDSKIR